MHTQQDSMWAPFDLRVLNWHTYNTPSIPSVSTMLGPDLDGGGKWKIHMELVTPRPSAFPQLPRPEEADRPAAH